MRKKSKIQNQKEKLSPGMIEASRWLAKNPKEASLFLPTSVVRYLKTMGFLTLWVALPVILILAMFTGPASFVRPAGQQPLQPEIFIQDSTQNKPEGFPVTFQVKLQGVNQQGVDQQNLYIGIRDPLKDLSYTFERVLVNQSNTKPDVFRGVITLPKTLLVGEYIFWAKGPVHLQRKFENVVFGEEQLLDLTDKPLLPGDLVLPQTGQDDKISDFDRDYLWSLLQAGEQRNLTVEEIKGTDLDLDGKITGRDMSLLIDSGVGSEGEE